MFEMQSRQSALMLFFVIICLVDDRQRLKNYLYQTNMLIQSGWASRWSPPSHNLHWFIISQFISTLFIDLNFSLLLSVMMPEVTEVSRCTWFVNVSRSWAIWAKLSDKNLWLFRHSSFSPCFLQKTECVKWSLFMSLNHNSFPIMFHISFN